MASHRQSNLREFQARLSERLRLAATAPAKEARLGFLVGQNRYLVRLEEAGEIVPVPAMTRVPLTKDWFRGVCNLRGSLHVVADLNRFSGGAFTTIDRESRMLALGTTLNFNAAILVSKMLGLRSMEQMQSMDDAGDKPWEGALLQEPDGTSWREIDLAQLAHDEDFLLVGRA
jgi:twitching motility protein PilI